jgi:hypothetical protein
VLPPPLPRAESRWRLLWPALLTDASFDRSFRSGTTAFRLFYKRVSAAIRQYASAQDWSGFESVYIELLLSGFFQEFVHWENPNPPALGEYLALVERRSSFRAYALMGHAYLHMAYDLPRTVADTRTLLDTPPGLVGPLYPPFPPFVPAGPPYDAALWTVARERYLELSPLFAKVLRRNAANFRFFGVMALPGLLLSGSASLSNVIAKWVAEIRTAALPRADTLLNPPPGEARAAVEARILTTMTVAVRGVLRRWWNPALWFQLPAAPPFLVSSL